MNFSLFLKHQSNLAKFDCTVRLMCFIVKCDIRTDEAFIHLFPISNPFEFHWAVWLPKDIIFISMYVYINGKSFNQRLLIVISSNSWSNFAWLIFIWNFWLQFFWLHFTTNEKHLTWNQDIAKRIKRQNIF